MSEFKLGWISLYYFLGTVIVMVYLPYLYAFAHTFNTCRTTLGKIFLVLATIAGAFGLFPLVGILGALLANLIPYFGQLARVIHG